MTDHFTRKFNIGDVIKNTDHEETFLITSINNKYYTCEWLEAKKEDRPYVSVFSVDFVENDFYMKLDKRYIWNKEMKEVING
jgi:hypothetical protein